MLWRKAYVTATIDGVAVDGDEVVIFVSSPEAIPEALLWGRLLDGSEVGWRLWAPFDVDAFVPGTVAARAEVRSIPQLAKIASRAAAIAPRTGRAWIGPATEDALEALFEDLA